MRLVVKSGPGTVEVAYMWLPTFLGMNSVLMQTIEAEVMPKLVGKDLTDDVLEEANELVLDIICRVHPLPGLRDYLDALKFVEG
jgi:hypothetical protein